MPTSHRTAILASLATAAILTAPMTTRAGELIEPVLVGTLETDFARIRVFGDTVLLAGGTSVRFVDVSDPTDPQIVGSVSPSVGTVNSAWLEDNTIYISMGQDGAEIVDVSDLQNPQIISTIQPLTDKWNGIYNAGGLCYALDHLYLGASIEYGGLLIYDVSDPSVPTLLNPPTTYADPHFSTARIEYREGVIFADPNYVGCFAIDATDPTDPNLILLTALGTVTSGLALSEQYAFFYTYDFNSPHYSPSMNIYDITDPLNPVGFSLPQGAYQRYGSEMAIAGNTLIKFPDKRTDISDVENPVYLPDFESELGYWGVVHGDYLYTMTQDDEFRIYSGFGTPSCPGDVTGDNEVDLADLNLVLANFGQTTSDGDTNDDGVVDLADLNAVLASFGTGCN